ncbi:MAG: hypothetical protein ACREA0_07645 [bacterium]
MPWPKGRPRGPLSPEHLAATRRKPRPPEPLPPGVREWSRYLWLALRKRSRGHRLPANIGRGSVEELARRLSLVGWPSDPEAQQMYQATVALLFSRGRLDPRTNRRQTLVKYLDLYPDNRSGLLRLLDSVKATAQIPGPGIAKASLSVDNFLRVAVQIPKGNAEEFVRFILGDPSRTKRTIAAIFCPGTFEYWKVRLRGLVPSFGETDDDAAERRKYALSRLRTVR